jgi:tetratricopeptide (TPR) repeat protein
LLRTYVIDNSSAGRETTALVLTRIASIHLKKGDLDQAMAHYREAYDLTVRNYGTTNREEVAGILHYIGGIYHKRADYDEAMTCYQEVIRIYHATLGLGNPTVAGTLVMVGSIYYKRRNLDNAMMFYCEALRLSRDAYGMHHPEVAPILKSIGTIIKTCRYHCQLHYPGCLFCRHCTPRIRVDAKKVKSVVLIKLTTTLADQNKMKTSESRY